MVRNKDKNQRRRHDPYKDGGRRFDEYVHDEFENPLEKAARERLAEKERKKNMRYSTLWLEIPLFIGFLSVIGMTITYHRQLHRTNECDMTYIYKPMIFVPLIVPGINAKKYKLIRYQEGRPDPSVFDIDIPVLFVPGSSGSGKQIRSLGTTIMNVTQLQMGSKFKSRFVFFACDFNEEFSFLSGATLMRQREFVVKSIETILQMYSETGVKKLVLIGHSFGGTILHSLPAHPRVDPKWMDLVITLGAPINGPPFMSDYYMELFYENTIKTWESRAKELTHVTLISYSGGIKDFMVPDHLARGPFKYTKDMQVIAGSRDGRVLFRPSWSMREVACDVDHNCLAWCNQLVNHISALVIRYGGEWKLPKEGAMKGSRQLVREFFQSRGRHEKLVHASQEPQLLFNASDYVHEDRRIVKMTKEQPNVVINVDVNEHDVVVNIRAKAGKCPPGVIGKHADLTFRSSENLTAYSSQQGDWMHMRMMPTFPETRRLKGVVRIGGTPDCEYEVEASRHFIGTLYRRLLDSTTLPFVVFYTLFLFAFLPVLRQNRLPSFFRELPPFYFQASLIMGLALLASMILSLRFFLERNSLTFALWIIGARLATFLISRPLQPLIGWISRVVERRSPKVRAGSRLILTILSLLMASNNLALGYAFVLLLLLFKVGPHSKNGLIFIIFSISILVSIGLAGNVRDGPAGVFQRRMDDSNPSGYMEAFYNIFYEYPHPLLFSFLITLFCFFLDLSQMMKIATDSSKEKFIGVFYCLLVISLTGVTNLESMAVVTAYYFVLFETLKEYKGLKAVDGTQIE